MPKEISVFGLCTFNTKKVVVLLFMLLLFGFFFWKSKQAPVEKEPEVVEVAEEKDAKLVETIVFGDWGGEGSREVLATVESTGDITLTAELSGTIDEVYVDIGDRVNRGQVLARYRRGDDQTFIGYQNAVSSLEQTKATTQNSITQAEIALRNAKAELERQKSLLEQGEDQAFTALQTQSLTVQTNVLNAVDWADRIVRGSNDYRFENTGKGSYVGDNNTVLKQQVRNTIRDLKPRISNLSENFFTRSSSLRAAQERLNLLEETRTILRDMDILIRQTPETSSFSSTDRAGFQQQADGYKSTIDGQVTALKAQMEAVESQESQSDLSLEQAQNRVKTAEANLSLAKANAEASINAANNSVSLANSSLSDLDVRSPFTGTISEKMVAGFQQVSPGTPLFSIVDDGTAPKVSAFVTKSELGKLLSSQEVEVVLDGESLMVSNASMSTKVDSVTQKIKVEYDLPKGDETLVGSLGRLKIPSNGSSNKLLPLTAISFEPDGAEVMVIEEGKVARKKVFVGDVIAGGMEINDGLELGKEVIRYRSRVYVGEKVVSEKDLSQQNK